MLERIEKIEAEATAAIAAAGSTAELEELRVRHLGRKAELTTILRGIAELPAEERGAVGAAANRARKALEELLEGRAGELDAAEMDARLVGDRVDVTLPGAPAHPAGHLHLITRTTRQIEDVMVGLGYRVVEGPEIEHDYYNFTALNHPPGHPARMLQDTFYVQSHPEVLLRTHTSPVQIRSMETQAPPVFLIMPGKVYRRDSDATHTPMFHQVEGLAIGEGITLADLKGTLEELLRAIFGEEREIRMRPHFFPFTEPSVEVDVSCFRCEGHRDAGWRRALQPLQGPGLDRDPRRRHGRPQRSRLRRRERLRPRAGSGLRLRHGGRADRDAAARRAGSAPLLRQRRADAGAIPMRVPFSWLREYCDPGIDAGPLAERLAMTGTEVERVGVRRAARGGGLRDRQGAWSARSTPTPIGSASARSIPATATRARSSAARPTSRGADRARGAAGGDDARWREARQGEAARRRVARNDPLRRRAGDRRGVGGNPGPRRRACSGNAAGRGAAGCRAGAGARGDAQPARLPRRLRGGARGARDQRRSARRRALGGRRAGHRRGRGRRLRLGDGRRARALPAVHRARLHRRRRSAPRRPGCRRA